VFILLPFLLQLIGYLKKKTKKTIRIYLVLDMIQIYRRRFSLPLLGIAPTRDRPVFREAVHGLIYFLIRPLPKLAPMGPPPTPGFLPARFKGRAALLFPRCPNRRDLPVCNRPRGSSPPSLLFCRRESIWRRSWANLQRSRTPEHLRNLPSSRLPDPSPTDSAWMGGHGRELFLLAEASSPMVDRDRPPSVAF